MSKTLHHRSGVTIGLPYERDTQPSESPANGVAEFVVSPELLQAYEAEPTYRGRTVIARTLWRSTPPSLKAVATQKHCHHGGHWLLETLGPIDARVGRPPVAATVWGHLLAFLGKDADLIWEWLDQRQITPSQMHTMVKSIRELMDSGLPWDQALVRAKDLLATKRHYQGHAEADFQSRRVRAAVEKTLQFAQIKKILEDAPSPASLPVPDGYDPQTYRAAYSDFLDNIRVAQWIARHDFHRAKRRSRSTFVNVQISAVGRACRTLRIAIPAPGMPVDEFSARRKWLEIVKACHPDKNGGDASKVRVYDEGTKAFRVITEHNRKLTTQEKEAHDVNEERHAKS